MNTLCQLVNKKGPAANGPKILNLIRVAIDDTPPISYLAHLHHIQLRGEGPDWA